MRYSFCIILLTLVSVIVPAQNTDALLEKAKKGSIPAQLELAQTYIYINGDNIEQDFNQALYWYEKAAEKNSVEAMVACGELLCLGIIKDPVTDCSPDYVKGLHYLKEAVKRGSIQEADRLLNIASQMGNTDAIAISNLIVSQTTK